MTFQAYHSIIMPFHLRSVPSGHLPRMIILAAGLLAVIGPTGATTPDRNLTESQATKRVALVIGNAAYPGTAALQNPDNDARDIAAKLKALGFDVTLRTDMPLRQMLRTLTEFGDKVTEGSEVLFFYAGHGMQVKGRNYLIPTDAEIRTESSVSSEAVDVDQLLDKLSHARLSMVILDACRNNPFERRFRGGGQGLAQINAPTGTLIAYATAPGKVAADGDGRNGLYTAELLNAMDVPGIKIEDVFKRVRSNVVKKSNDAQTPWESSSLTGDFYFVLQGPTTTNFQLAPSDPEGEAWRAAESANSTGGYKAYLGAYQNGRYAVAARIKLEALANPTSPAAKSTAPTPSQMTTQFTQHDSETAMWNEVKVSGAREYIDAYLKQYPKGKYVALAKIEVRKLDERDKAQRAKDALYRQQAAERERQVALRSEQVAWDDAKTAANAAAYASYLERFPKGRYAALAQSALPRLQRDEVEKEKRAAERILDEERRKLAAERERREAEDLARKGSAPAVEQQDNEREEAARPLEWAESDNDSDINWAEAKNYCASKGSGWRLPSAAELQNTYKSGKSTRCGEYQCSVASKSRLTGSFFWTNEAIGSFKAWTVYLHDGTRNSADVGWGYGWRALCVR